MVLLGIIDNIPVRIILGSLIFVAMAIWIHSRIKTSSRWRGWGWLICWSGVCSNITVVLANGGFMPCLNRIYYFGIWSPMTTQTIYPFLGDRFWGASIGDFMIGAGVVVILVEPMKAILGYRGYNNNLERAFSIPSFCLGVAVCFGSKLLAIVLYPITLGHSIRWWKRLDNSLDKILTYFHQPYSNTISTGSGWEV